jgi:peptidoglycan/LPS O-acetylase OafA/YrhL
MRNLSGLTSIRFFAALWVVLYHLAPNWDLLRNVGPIVYVGYSAVTLFFVLSGFILSYNYLSSDYRPQEFWVARAARVLPVYFAALIVSIPVFLHQCLKQGIPFVPAAFYPVVMVQAWIPKVALLWNGPGWSLSCEAFFYLLFPLILAPMARLFRRTFAGTFAAVWILGIVPSLIYAFVRPEGLVDFESHATLLSVIKFNPILRLPEFILGIGIGACYVDGKRFSNPVATAVLSVIGLVVLIVSLWKIFQLPTIPNRTVCVGVCEVGSASGCALMAGSVAW